MYDKKGREKQNLNDFFIAGDSMYEGLKRYILKVYSIDIEKIDQPNFRVTVELEHGGTKYHVSCHRAKIVFVRAEDEMLKVHIISDTDIPKELEKLIKTHKKGN